jgi:hypothetical protein
MAATVDASQGEKKQIDSCFDRSSFVLKAPEGGMGTKKNTYRHKQAPRHRTRDNRRATRHYLTDFTDTAALGARAARGRLKNKPSTTQNTPLARRNLSAYEHVAGPNRAGNCALPAIPHPPRHRMTGTHCCHLSGIQYARLSAQIVPMTPG